MIYGFIQDIWIIFVSGGRGVLNLFPSPLQKTSDLKISKTSKIEDFGENGGEQENVLFSSVLESVAYYFMDYTANKPHLLPDVHSAVNLGQLQLSLWVHFPCSHF